ncbi:hypothetical protein NM688_g8471 [Phlebia brevispora]|uniref:Uncharacterized protein n=1 Tax=Phlebia brevispora TaxID=194682 RepID=A0ACC1RU71_9APHY|nr:hypothetical protein NM688_g8471 [Phlebia brevispora]
MATHDVPIETAYIVSLWLEALVYGFFLCIFCGSLYVNLSLRKNQDTHSRMMFYTIVLMFILATLHVSANCYRMIEAYVSTVDPAIWMSILSEWSYVFKDILFVSMEILGDAAAIYRTFVIWGRDWKPIAIPCTLFIVSMVMGYLVCYLYTTENYVFLENWGILDDSHIMPIIITFFTISVIQSGMTTSLMAFRIWQTDRRAAAYRTNKAGNLMPILRILIESAFTQFMAELTLLVLYALNYNVVFIIQEMSVPLIGIAFGAITIRVALHQEQLFQGSRFHSGDPPGSYIVGRPIATIGSIPMRQMPISISITKDVEAHEDFHQVDSALSYS